MLEDLYSDENHPVIVIEIVLCVPCLHGVLDEPGAMLCA